MTDDRVLGLLTEILDGQPSTAPDRLLASVIQGVRTAPQRRAWRSTRASWRGLGGPSVRWLALGGLFVLIVVVGTQSAPRPEHSVGPTTAPSTAPSPTVGSSPPVSRLPTVTIDDTGLDLLPGATYTSKYFEPVVTFQVRQRSSSEPTRGEWCAPAYTSSRVIVFRHRAGCVQEMEFLRPIVECGIPGPVDADTLATAILTNPGLEGVVDLGGLETEGAVPPGMFAAPYHGRVIRIPGTRPFDGNVTDPDQCRLRPADLSDDPIVEIRGDLAATLILLDIDGELVVLRVASSGHDAASGVDAHSRGYGTTDPEQLWHLLTINHDIRFGP